MKKAGDILWHTVDGGTSVADTSEVGRMRSIDNKGKGRINKRLAIALEP